MVERINKLLDLLVLWMSKITVPIPGMLKAGILGLVAGVVLAFPAATLACCCGTGLVAAFLGLVSGVIAGYSSPVSEDLSPEEDKEAFTLNLGIITVPATRGAVRMGGPGMVAGLMTAVGTSIGQVFGYPLFLQLAGASTDGDPVPAVLWATIFGGLASLVLGTAMGALGGILAYQMIGKTSEKD